MKRRILIILFALATVIIGGTLIYLKLKDYFAIKECLASGGSWNYEMKLCEYMDTIINLVDTDVQNISEKTKEEPIMLEAIDSLELIYDFEFYLKTEMEEWYNSNYKLRINSQIFHLCDIYTKPNIESSLVGEMISFYDTIASNFRIQIIDTCKNVIKELTQIGDWGYGIHLTVVAQSESFVKLPFDFLMTDAWIPKKPLNGYSESFKGKLISVSAVTLTNMKSGEILNYVSGSYLVKDIKDGHFILRKEIPEDMPYKEDFIKTENIDSLPEYYLNINELKSEEGGYNIGITYARGL